MRTIAVTFALPAESSEFLRRMRDKSARERNGVRTIQGKIDNRSIEVLHTGVGENLCRQRIGVLLQNQRFDFLISAGFAGSLTGKLQVNDLLIAKNFSTVDLKDMQSSLSKMSITAVNMLTVPGVIGSNQEREKIARASSACAVDMETEFIARACAIHGIPLLSLRVITDTPRQPFPAPPNTLFDIERQQTRVLRFAMFFLKRPNRTPRLIQFARRIARARTTLTNALINLVRNL